MQVYDDRGPISAEVFSDPNGYLLIDNLTEGTYTVLARSYRYNDPNQPDDVTPTISTITINNVSVVADQVTNLGTISFN